MAQNLFSVLKNLYRNHLITKEALKKFVRDGQITPEEYEMITGEPYEG